MDQKINQLTDKEHAWVADQLERAPRFVAEFSPTDASQPLTLSALDRAFAAWLAADQRDTQLVNGALNCVGVAFGQFLVDRIAIPARHPTDLATGGKSGSNSSAS